MRPPCSKSITRETTNDPSPRLHELNVRDRRGALSLVHHIHSVAQPRQQRILLRQKKKNGAISQTDSW
jgi:hypothetical protein